MWLCGSCIMGHGASSRHPSPRHPSPHIIIQCMHIFPHSTNVSIPGSNEVGPKVRIHVPYLGRRQLLAPNLARVCCDYVDIMRCFGYEDLPEKLNGAGVHRLDNITTLDHTIHSWFDELQLWLDAEVRGLQFSVLTLNVCRTARRTPILSVWQKKHTASRARKIQSCSKVHTQTFRCQTLSTSRFAPHVITWTNS